MNVRSPVCQTLFPQICFELARCQAPWWKCSPHHSHPISVTTMPAPCFELGNKEKEITNFSKVMLFIRFGIYSLLFLTPNFMLCSFSLPVFPFPYTLSFHQVLISFFSVCPPVSYPAFLLITHFSKNNSNNNNSKQYWFTLISVLNMSKTTTKIVHKITSHVL